MDDQHFDDLARRLARGASRRALLKGILGTAGGVLAARGAGRGVDAKPKAKCQSNAECGSCQTCEKKKCVPIPEGSLCGDCGTCSGGACTPSPDTPGNSLACGLCEQCGAGGTCQTKADGAACGQCGACSGGLQAKGGGLQPER